MSGTNITFDEAGGCVILSQNEMWYVQGNPKITKVKKTRQQRQKNDNNFPIFKEFLKFTTDPFWVNFLEDAFKNIFPQRYRFDGTHLIYRYRKTFSVELKTASKIKFQEIKEFMWKSSSFESTLDSTNRKPEATPQVVEELTWKKIKISQKRIEQAIGGYVSKLKAEHNLSMDDFIILFIAIKSWISSGIFDKDAFICERGIIKEIKGMHFDPVERKLVISIDKKSKDVFVRSACNSSETPTSICQEQIYQKNNFSEYWKSYIKFLNSD